MSLSRKTRVRVVCLYGAVIRTMWRSASVFLCVMLVSVCAGNVISELQEPPDSQSRDAAGEEKEANEVCLNTSSLLLVRGALTDLCLRAKFVSCKI